MRLRFYYFLIMLLGSNYALSKGEDLGSANIISFFVQEYPEQHENPEMKQIANECSILKNHFQTTCKSYNIGHNFAIFSTYAGYLSLSDANGQITFPRKVVNNSINLLVANKISPVLMFGATVAFWEIQDANAKMYSFTRKQDKQTKLFYWSVKQKTLPKSNRIPVQTIVIFADSKDIYVPTGITLTRSSANLILPDVYVKKNINTVDNMLFVLNIKPFFSKTAQQLKHLPLGYESLVVA